MRAPQHTDASSIERPSLHGSLQVPALSAPDPGAQLRHPHVLQFKDSVEVDGDKPGTVTLYLVTEPVQPLSTVLQDLRLDGSQRCAPGVCAVSVDASPFLTDLLSDDYIALGLSQVAQAVAFLNADCKMVRCPAALVKPGP